MATKKQHYIPRMILKRFCVSIPMRKGLIYQYDKKSNIERLIPISDICWKKNLYELKDSFGKISDNERNLIENRFSDFERKWDQIIIDLENQKKIETSEIAWLYFLLALQVLRMPEVMNFTSCWIYETSNNLGFSLSENDADRYAKLASFVFDDCFSPCKNGILNAILNFLVHDSELVIYKSETDFILNGDRPVLLLQPFRTIYFPIASRICLGLIPHNKSLYMSMPRNFVSYINRQNFENEGRFIYYRMKNSYSIYSSPWIYC